MIFFILKIPNAGIKKTKTFGQTTSRLNGYIYTRLEFSFKIKDNNLSLF